MSLKAMLWALESAPRGLTPTERFVLVALADHVDDDTGQAWPSLTRLCARTGLSRRTMQRALAQLEAQRVVTVDPGGAVWRRADRRTSLYTWHPENAKQERQDPAQAALFRVDNSVEEASERGVRVTPRTAENDSRGVRVTPRTGCQGDTQTVRENQQSKGLASRTDVAIPRAQDVDPVDNGEAVGEGFAAFLEAKEALKRRPA